MMDLAKLKISVNFNEATNADVYICMLRMYE